MNLLSDQVVMVTGSLGGQGAAHARRSAAAGADILLTDTAPVGNRAALELMAEIKSLGRAATYSTADVTSAEELRLAVAHGVATLGRIATVIANAGVYRSAPFWEVPEEDWNFVLGVNLTGAWRTIKAVAPHMMSRGSGSIVLISSVDAIDPEVGSTAYGVSKAGLLGLMKYIALEVAPHGLRCNAVAPGFVDTAMVNTQEFYDSVAGAEGAGTRQDLIEYGHRYNAMKGVSMLLGEDIADTAVYLNSHLAQHVTGATIPVDAGRLLVGRMNQNPTF